MGKYLVRQENCLEGLRKLKGKSVDVVVTSPPYNIKMDYSLYGDDMSVGSYLQFMREVVIEIHRILKEDGSFFLNIGSQSSHRELEVRLLSNIISTYSASNDHEYFKIQNHITWVKSIAFDNDSKGHYKPVNSPRFLSSMHESVYHLTKNKDVILDKLAIGVPYKHKSNIQRYGGGQDLRCRGNVWFIPYETINSKREHPCPFPVELPEYCIKLHGVDRCSYVLDPFLGSGNTLVAAKKIGIKRAVGYEIDPVYVKLAQEKLDSTRKE